MRDLLDVVKVEVLQDYQLLLEFENGEKRLFDMKERNIRDRYIMLDIVKLIRHIQDIKRK